jgi:sodium-independent sulfate anion transporter 11
VIVEFVSAPVSAGFISAAAIVIVASQLKSILGLTGVGGEDIIHILRGLYAKIDQTNFEDVAMGCCSIVLLMLMRVSS